MEEQSAGESGRLAGWQGAVRAETQVYYYLLNEETLFESLSGSSGCDMQSVL